MSAANQIERAHAAAAGAVINPSGPTAGGADDRATRLATVEAAAAAVETAREATATAQAAAAAQRAEMEREPAGGSRSPDRRRR